MEPINSTQFWINKDNLSDIYPHQMAVSTDALAKDEVLLKIESFGFSANNITYAAMGNSMGYWGFFPAENSAYGILPVWGFAVVAYSHHPDIRVGDKVFGYLPMASHWVVKPDKLSAHGFTDSHNMRKSISPVYDQYLFCRTDPGYQADQEAWQMAFRPLFMTAFALADHVLHTSRAKQIILTSASSKTALGTAALLSSHRAIHGADYRIVGMTSARNTATLAQMSCYDDVIEYGDVERTGNDVTTVLLDFAADGALIHTLNRLLTDKLEHAVLIGATNWDASVKTDFRRVNASIFFAPDHVQKMQKRDGKDAFFRQYAAAWGIFMDKFTRHFVEQPITGTESIKALYLATLKGDADTTKLNVVSF